MRGKAGGKLKKVSHRETWAGNPRERWPREEAAESLLTGRRRRWCEPPLGELKGHFMTTINSAWHPFIFSAGNKTKARAEVTDGVGLKQEGCVCVCGGEGGL